MHYAELYEKVNEAPNLVSKSILDKYHTRIRRRRDGRDKVIDVGCGTGSTLIKYIKHTLPPTFEAVLGVDISEEMIAFAHKKYHCFKKCSFRVLDITTQELPPDLCEQFDLVTSFFALQWVHDQETALANIYKLLRQEVGDCLFGILMQFPVYDIYLVMHKTSKWAPHMADINTALSSLYYCKNPVQEYTQLLVEAGFRNCLVEVHEGSFTYNTLQELKDLVKAVCPFMKNFSEEQQEDFLNDFCEIAQSPRQYELDLEFDYEKFVFPYKVLAVHAQKTNYCYE